MKCPLHPPNDSLLCVVFLHNTPSSCLRYKNNNYFLNGYREVWLERAFKASSFDRLFSLLTVKWNCGENASFVLPPPPLSSFIHQAVDRSLPSNRLFRHCWFWLVSSNWLKQTERLRRTQKEGKKKEKKNNWLSLAACTILWLQYKRKSFCCYFASCFMMISRFFFHLTFFTGVQFYMASVVDFN